MTRAPHKLCASYEERRSVTSRGSEAGEHAAGVGSEEMGSEEAGCYFPLEFTIDSMPTWRVKKDQRQLVKLQLAEKFDAIRMRKKKKRKKGPGEGAVSPR